MRFPATFALLCLLWCTSAFAQITASKEYPEHSLVTALNERDADSYVWTVLYSHKDLGLMPVETRTCDIGKEVVFTGPPGRYAIIGLALKGTKLSQDTTFIIIGGKPTPTPPDPDNPPDPDVPTPPTPPTPVNVPDDEFDNVGKKTAQLVSLLPDSARAKAQETANMYKQAVAKLENGEFINITQAANWVKSERVNVWKDDTPAWAAVTGPIGEVWDKHWTAKSGLTKAECIAFYNAVIAGLEAGAKNARRNERSERSRKGENFLPREGNSVVQEDAAIAS